MKEVSPTLEFTGELTPQSRAPCELVRVVDRLGPGVRDVELQAAVSARNRRTAKMRHSWSSPAAASLGQAKNGISDRTSTPLQTSPN